MGRGHDRKTFDCGSPQLNDYLRRHAGQNHEGGGSKTFVAVSVAAPETFLGYYSISPASIAFAKVPAALTKGLERYKVAVFRLARLAVALSTQGQGLGGDLLLAGGVRALAVAAQVGGVALAIDAKDEKAARWYALERRRCSTVTRSVSSTSHVAAVFASWRPTASASSGWLTRINHPDAKPRLRSARSSTASSSHPARREGEHARHPPW